MIFICYDIAGIAKANLLTILTIIPASVFRQASCPYVNRFDFLWTPWKTELRMAFFRNPSWVFCLVRILLRDSKDITN